MWDLDTLYRMNHPKLEKRLKVDGPPLAILAQKLKSAAPPSLSVLVAIMRDSEEYGGFIDLIREYVPEYEREILQQTDPASQFAIFSNHFQDRYFPLEDRMFDETYGSFTRCIPVIVSGMTYDDYEELSSDNYRPGVQLLTYLVENPYIGTDRVALAEACEGHVPEELLLRIPEGGFTCELLHRLLDKTRFEAAALWADYLNASTGNFFLDTDYELLMSGYAPEWDRKMVEHLTTQWQQAEKHQEQTTSLMVWLEEDPPGRFRELLDFIEERQKQNEGGEL